MVPGVRSIRSSVSVFRVAWFEHRWAWAFPLLPLAAGTDQLIKPAALFRAELGAHTFGEVFDLGRGYSNAAALPPSLRVR